MKLFTLMVVALSSVAAFAGESTDCKNIVTDGSKLVACEKLSGAEKDKCMAANKTDVLVNGKSQAH